MDLIFSGKEPAPQITSTLTLADDTHESEEEDATLFVDTNANEIHTSENSRHKPNIVQLSKKSLVEPEEDEVDKVEQREKEVTIDDEKLNNAEMGQTYSNQPFNWKILKLWENPKAFLDFK